MSHQLLSVGDLAPGLQGMRVKWGADSRLGLSLFVHFYPLEPNKPSAWVEAGGTLAAPTTTTHPGLLALLAKRNEGTGLNSN